MGEDVRKEERDGNGSGCSPEGEHEPVTGSSVLCFTLSLAGGNLRGGLRGGFQ